jgi:GNAT superfamily N-acetyltransferase
MINNLKFRDYLRFKDINVIKSIVESVNKFRPDEIEIAEELASENYEKGAQKSGYHFILAEIHEDIVGYGCFGPIGCTVNRYDLYWIVVKAGFHNMGIGKFLLKQIEDKVSELDGERIYVETSSKQSYESTRKFYLNNNYVVEATLKDFYDNGDSKVIFMKKL